VNILEATSVDPARIRRSGVVNSATKAFAREDQVEFPDVPGFVVLLDKDMQEVVPRQDARIYWRPLRGGATYQINSSPHDFEIIEKSIYYLAVGNDERLMLISPVIGAPVEHGIMHVC
jgi:hypothetical protein